MCMYVYIHIYIYIYIQLHAMNVHMCVFIQCMHSELSASNEPFKGPYEGRRLDFAIRFGSMTHRNVTGAHLKQI